MTLTAREPVHTATRAVHRVGDNLATLGMHVSFYFRTIASIPYAISKFRKHVIAQISEVSFGTQSLLSMWFHDELLPVLTRCQVPATVFVTTGAIAGRPTWFQRLFAAMDRTTRAGLPAFDGVPATPLGTPAQRVEARDSRSGRLRRAGHAHSRCPAR